MENPVEKLGEEKVTRILQAKELSMLKDVKRMFEEYKIPFCLACGTALGCARHQGFIPWDDDIDIYVKGSDYLRIKAAFTNESTGILKFHDYSTVGGYPYTFPKIISSDTVLVEKSLGSLNYTCGVYIDVFPLFGISDNMLIRTIQEKSRYIRYALLRAYYNDGFSKGLRRVIKGITRTFFNPVELQKQLEQTYMNAKIETQFLIDPSTFNKNALIKRKTFSDIIYMKFEDTTMPMPIGYKEYLTDYYGDYMQLPPKQERVSRHHISKLEIHGVVELED